VGPAGWSLRARVLVGAWNLGAPVVSFLSAISCA